jgi:hypothetical protein
MKQIIFYSWQSDLPNSTNRGFIQEALESAAATIAADASVEVEPVVDRDTQGVPGAPEIASTIFSKISASDAFVADVSIIGRTNSRSTSNPNVLIELGYALKAIGHENVVLVFNRAFGKVEELPFDLKVRRVLTYEMPLEGKPRGQERKALEKQFEGALRAALGNRALTPEPSVNPLLVSIESQAPNRLIVLRRSLSELLEKLDQAKPRTFSDGCSIDELTEGLNQTEESVTVFSRITETIALMSDLDAAVEIIRWFGQVFERYRLPAGFSGSYRTSDQDYFKFLGHEMLVTFVAFLLRELRMSIIDSVLEEPIPLRYLSRMDGPGAVTWVQASDHLPSLLDESPRRRRVSLHSDLLNERHSAGELGSILPIEEFASADFFLYLLGEIRQSDRSDWGFAWRPWSYLYLKSTPLFLVNSERKKIADQMTKLFQISDVKELRQEILRRASEVGKLFSNGLWLNPIRPEIIEKIGTK